MDLAVVHGNRAGTCGWRLKSHAVSVLKSEAGEVSGVAAGAVVGEVFALVQLFEVKKERLQDIDRLIVLVPFADHADGRRVERGVALKHARLGPAAGPHGLGPNCEGRSSCEAPAGPAP